MPSARIVKLISHHIFKGIDLEHPGFGGALCCGCYFNLSGLGDIVVIKRCRRASDIGAEKIGRLTQLICL